MCSNVDLSTQFLEFLQESAKYIFKQKEPKTIWIWKKNAATGWMDLKDWRKRLNKSKREKELKAKKKVRPI